MKKILALCLFIMVSATAMAQEFNPVSWRHAVNPTADGQFEVSFTATIDKPWHMYDMGPYTDGPNATTITIEPAEGLEIVGDIRVEGELHKEFDKIFKMDIGTYTGTVTFTQTVRTTLPSVTLTATADWQVCDDTSCLPPMDEEFTITIGDAAAAASLPAAAAGGPTVDTSLSDRTSDEASIWIAILEAILWGFAAMLTPCVFPMVPMTVSFFMKGSENKAKGRFMASLYGISIVALYTIPIAVIILITYFVGGDAVTTDIFNWLATHWIPNVLFFLVFMFFAASFFGAFEIVMPSWLVNKSDAKADKGGMIGVFFMALTLVLVSFSCTGPIVGTILIKSTQGEIWEPIVTMMAFSAAFALPFTIFAFFPSMLKNLPKSGGWLNSVKVVLGFIELALGLKFLSVADQTYHWGLLDREVYLALWIVIFSLLGLYFLGKLRFAHDSKMEYIPVKRLFLAIATFAFVVYMIPGMFGAPLKVLSGYLPPQHTLDFDLSKSRAAVATPSGSQISDKPKYSDFLHLPHGLEGFFDYAEGLAYAQKVGKPIFLDFTGHGCVNCREMEANVLSDPTILQILSQDYVIISLYVDDKKVLPEADWVTTDSGKVLKTIGKINAELQLRKFGINAQPYYVLLSSQGDVLTKPKSYDKSIDNFIAFLREGITKFNESK